MVFKQIGNTNDYYFAKSILWNMPEKDLDVAKEVWEKTKQKVLEGDYKHLPRMADSSIAHVRLKAQKAINLYPTPQGTYEKKKCFWLNGTYIKKTLQENSPELFS